MSSEDLYEECQAQAGNSSGDAVLQCVTQNLSSNADRLEDFVRTITLIFSAALVFYMQAGFAMVCAGMVRKKNVRNTMLKNLMDACTSSATYFSVGYAFAFGGMKLYSPDKTFIGHTNFFLMNVDDYGFWLFQWAFSAASCTIVAGTLAERCQMSGYLSYSVLITGFVYPIVAHSIWNTQGFLSANSVDPLWNVGTIDFAGSGVVHITGGLTALYATYVLGPRRGRFHDEDGNLLEEPHEIPGHSPALQVLGSLILWFGWYGFNAGSSFLFPSEGIFDAAKTAGLAAVNTTLAGGFGGIISLFVNLYYYYRVVGEPVFDITFLMNGALSGLVSITAGCGVVEPWAAAVIGILAGLIYPFSTRGLVKLRLDDAVDAIPVHLVSGVLGMIMVGFFASPSRLEAAYGRSDHPGWFYDVSDGTLLGAQLVGTLFIFGWVSALMFPFFLWLDWRGYFRADALEEIVGLDTSYHGGKIVIPGGDDDDGPTILDAAAYNKWKEERRQSRHRGRELVHLDTGAVSDSNHSNKNETGLMGKEGEGTEEMGTSNP